MVKLQYKGSTGWGDCGVFAAECAAWISLGDDNANYRTVDAISGEVLTDKHNSDGYLSWNCDQCSKLMLDSDPGYSAGDDETGFCSESCRDRWKDK